MKKIITKINFNKESLKRILSRIVCCKRLLFILFFGILLIFTFDVVYKYAFLNVKYISYTEDDSFIIVNGRINNMNLNRVLKNIEEDEEKIKTKISKEYKTPFKFNNPISSNEFDYEIKYGDESDNVNSDNLDDNENNEGDDAIPFEL